VRRRASCALKQQREGIEMFDRERTGQAGSPGTKERPEDPVVARGLTVKTPLASALSERVEGGAVGKPRTCRKTNWTKPG
jgi:hypothetical protein